MPDTPAASAVASPFWPRVPGPARTGFLLGCALLAGWVGWVPYTTGWGEEWMSIANWTARIWSEVEDAQHGIIVLPLGLYLVWRQRAHLATLPVQGSSWGLPVLAGAAVLFWLGREAGLAQVGYLAAVVALAGLVLTFLGRNVLRAVQFPIAFLLFGLPLGTIAESLAFQLRWIMASGSVGVLEVFGIPVVRDGTAILSAGNPVTGLIPGKVFSLDVADPCSGIRSLTALTMLAALVAHFTQRQLWKKWVVFLSAAPFAVLGNMVRVVSVGVMAAWFDPSFATGTFHDLAGFGVFLVALAGMTGLAGLLGTDWRRAVPAWRRHLLAPARPAAEPSGKAPGPEPARASDSY